MRPAARHKASEARYGRTVGSRQDREGERDAARVPSTTPPRDGEPAPRKSFLSGSLGRTVARGVAWSIFSSIGARAIGLVGTLLLTRYVAPSAYGEVAVASVLVTTAQQFSTLGLGQYVVANPNMGRGVVFHVTVYVLLLGAIALAGLALLGPAMGRLIETPGVELFLPGLLIAGVFDRLAFVPERVLVRDFRFRALGINRTLGEVAYTGSALGFAVLGFGGMAIVYGNIVRAALRCLFYVGSVNVRDWLAPTRLSRATSAGMFAFGLPLSLAGFAAFASRRWDNLLVARFFGPGVAGTYNLAYNLADVPAIQIGEQVGDVLLPSFARMQRDRRAAALERSLRLLGLLVYPLAVGLGAVAHTLVATLFDERWQSVGPMLMLLASLSVTRPVSWTIAGYMQAQGYPRTVLLLESIKLVAVLGAIGTMGSLGPLWTCVAVGVGFAVHTVASCYALQRREGLSANRLLTAVARPLLACIPLMGAVFLLRWLLSGVSIAPVVKLLLEVALGGAVYVAAAFLLLPTASRELLARARDAWPGRA